MKRNLILLFTTVLIFLTTTTSHAQTTLAAGDIAIIGVNKDAVPYELTIVTLVDIESGTTIYITDYAWDGSAFSTTASSHIEGCLSWTTTSSISAGSVFKIEFNVYTTSVSGLPGIVSTTGWTHPNPNSNPSSSSGEGWFIFTGNSYTDPTTFIFGWTNYSASSVGAPNDWVFSNQVVGLNFTKLPSSLANGSTAISLAWHVYDGGSHGDNNVYNGIQAGSKSALLAAICNYTNWLSDEITTYDVSAGGSYFSGSNPIFTISGSCAMTASITAQTNAECNGGSTGSLTVTRSGGTANFSYAWSNGSSTSNTASANNTISSLVAGTYTVTVTDANSCTATASATITEPTAITASLAIDSNVTCNGFADGGSTASVTGGTASYSYLWSNSATTASITGIAAGTYHFTVTDANSCTATASNTVTEPTALSVTVAVDSTESCSNDDGGATATPSGGTAGYSYLWSNAATTASITGIAAGNYTATVTDAHGCTASGTTAITKETNCIPVWNGTGSWSDNPNWNEAPDALDSVVIQSGTITVNATATVNDLTIESGAVVVVQSGHTLTVTGNYINNGGTFSVQNGGSIIFEGELKRGTATRMKTFGKLKVMSGSLSLGN